MSDPRLQLQVALRVPPRLLSIAGMPAVLRAAFSAGSLPQVERVVLTGDPEPLESAWPGVLGRVPKLSENLAAGTATLELSGEGLPDSRALARFCAEALSGAGETAWIWRGEPVAVFVPATDPAASQTRGASVSTIPAADGAWIPARDPGEIRAAEAALFASLGKPTDGFLSRFDRRISTALSRRLAATAVTPNAITWTSIVIGVAGALAIAVGSPGPAIPFVGTLLVWLSAILDGCDGELARLKWMASEGGARLDLFGDHVVNFAVLAAVAVHVHRARPPGFAAASILLALGVAASAWTVARFQSAARGPGRRDLALAVERLASRDFVYLLIPLAALNRLDWFFWAAAVGSNLFWLLLWALHRRTRAARRDTTSQSPA